MITEARTITITCQEHLSSYLEQEIVANGFEVKKKGKTHVETFGTPVSALRLVMNLRTASRVLWKLFEFPASSIQEFYQRMKEQHWDELIDVDGYFSIRATAVHPEVKHSVFLVQRLKDSIADFFISKYKRRPDSGIEAKGVVIYVHWINNLVTVYLDIAGDTLAKHGYRKKSTDAPLLEGTATGVLMATGWTFDTPIVDPMCGSGTFAIEAAMMAMNIAPGLLRGEPSIVHVKNFPHEVWKEEMERAKTAIQKKSLQIIAGDRNPQALSAARINAKEAGVSEQINFQLCRFDEIKIPNGPGTVIVNPPYGERLGEQAELIALYRSLGDFFKKRCGGYNCFVLTENGQLTKEIGLRPAQKMPFINGKLDCRLLKYPVYAGTRGK